MVEEEKADEKKPEDNAGVDKRANVDLIAQANSAAERLEAANKALEKNLARQEAMFIEQKLGGRSNAGTPPQKLDETPEEYAARVMRNEVQAKD
jgi:hypothetical protein